MRAAYCFHLMISRWLTLAQTVVVKVAKFNHELRVFCSRHLIRWLTADECCCASDGSQCPTVAVLASPCFLPPSVGPQFHLLRFKPAVKLTHCRTHTHAVLTLKNVCVLLCVLEILSVLSQWRDLSVVPVTSGKHLWHVCCISGKTLFELLNLRSPSRTATCNRSAEV